MPSLEKVGTYFGRIGVITLGRVWSRWQLSFLSWGLSLEDFVCFFVSFVFFGCKRTNTTCASF